jgi:hypothetical protein
MLGANRWRDKARFSKCHAGLVTPNGLTAHEQPAEPDGPGSQQAIGRYRATGGVRWYPVVFAVLWLLLGIVQFVGRQQFGALAFAAVYTALAVTVWVVPKTVISDRGVRFIGRRTIPWSEVVDVVAQPNNRWKQLPELVLADRAGEGNHCWN